MTDHVTQAAELVERNLTAEERAMLEPLLHWVPCPHCLGAAKDYTGGTFCPVCQRAGRMLAATANIVRTALIFADVDCSQRAALQEDVARLSAELAARSGGWQTMDTAPKDGSDIVLLAHGMEIEARYCPGEWSDDTPITPAEYSGAVWSAFDDALQFEIEEGAGPDGEDLHGQVTHWRPKLPLPTPPAISSMEAPSHG